MASDKPDHLDPAAPSFGGCNRLLSHYHLIGLELLKYDRSVYRYGYRTSYELSDFREGVATVPVEVLESYLEDLLDLEVSDESLFIPRERFSALFQFIALFGLCLATGVGLYAATNGASLLISFALTVALAVPFGVLWHFSPRTGIVRRLGFAQIVSHEVSRRRGRSDKDITTPNSAGLLIREFLGRRAQGSARGAAKVIFH